MVEEIRFGRLRQILDIPALTELQVKAYIRFLQRVLACHLFPSL